ncbi:hypothetical protein GMSM_36700 [Geomonas sp. Red276]
MNNPNSGPDGKLVLGHIALLVAGLLAGLLAVYLFNGINFDFSAELSRARQLGIVSKTILMQYGKGRDVLNYLAMVGFPISLGVLAWYAWALLGHRRQDLRETFAAEPAGPGEKVAWWALAVAALAYLVLSFNVNLFHVQAYNTYVGAWPFLGEEGENLAWAQALMNGATYGKDFHCLYGPMLICPLAWFMRAFGTTVVAAREYGYLLNLAAYGIVLAFLYRSLKSTAGFLVAAACYILIFKPDTLLAPNETYLRVALGLVPILLVALRKKPAPWRMLIAGVVLGQSILFSQEVGICSLITVLVLLAVQRKPEQSGGFVKDALLAVGGTVLSMLPLLSYFASQGALKAFLDNLLVHPRLLGLGFTALVFPDFRTFLAAPFSGEVIYHYWVIFVYIGAALYLLPLLMLGRRDRDTLLRSALLLFGGILYRAALARSDAYHVQFVAPPAFLLAFLFVEDALRPLAREKSAALVNVRLAMATLIIASICLLAANSVYVSPARVALGEVKSLAGKLTRHSNGVPVPELPRGGIDFDPRTAASVRTIGAFLARTTRPGEDVFFFPNEAAYYFLFNRNNPTRYAISYFAVTAEQRRELIADLERKRPQYAVFSRNTWRVDNIPENIQVPEVCDYLTANYVPVADAGDVVFLKRKEKVTP